MQIIVTYGDNVHETSMPIFWEKKEKTIAHYCIKSSAARY